MRRIIAGLDIGTNELKLVVGEILKNKLNVLLNTISSLSSCYYDETKRNAAKSGVGRIWIGAGD